MIASHRIPEPLLALRDVSAEWRAGLPPTCSIAARLLDRVHLVVCRGDCVVVRHEDPASAQVLLAALQGGATWQRLSGWQGARLQAPGVRIRRASIRADIVSTVLEGWRMPRDSAENMPDPARESVHRDASKPPVVHLLRGSRDGHVPRHELAAWRRWAHQVRQAGGALVVVAPLPETPRGSAIVTTGMDPDPHRRQAPPRPHAPLGAGGTLLHERPATVPTPTGRAVRDLATLRTLWLHHGRVQDLHFTTPRPEPNSFGSP